MADEIEEFIRRAAERRKQQQGQRKPAAKPPVTPPPVVNKPRTLVSPPTVEAEIVPAEMVEHVSSHVASHLDNRQFNERASHLGEETALADDRLEAHLHQKFDHQLGRLARSSSAVDTAATTTNVAVNLPPISPSALVAMLRSPQQIRNAIILSEVLARPEHHW